MALNQVTLTLDVYNGAGQAIQQGTAFLSPSQPLTDTTDHQYVWETPVAVALEPPPGASPTWLPTVVLDACDNANLSPSGWLWEITFQSPGSPPGFSFALNFSNGASQYLSAQVPATSSSPVASNFQTPSAAEGFALPAVGWPLLSVGNLTTGQYAPLSAAAGSAQAAMMPWRAALANRAASRCDVVFLGDSITEGQHATSETLRFLAGMRSGLRARFPFPGQPTGGRGFLGVATSGESSFTWPAVLAGSPAAGTTLGPKSQFVNLSSGSTTVTYSLTGDSADIFWTQVPFGGTFGWKVDSGSVTSVSTNGGSIVDGKVTHISLGSAGAHTLTLSWVSGGTASMTGVVEYNGDFSSGIQTHDAGHFGWATSSWVSVLSGGATGPAAAIASLTPNLIVITLGVNDQFANVAPATFQSNTQSIISSLKAQLTAPYPAFLLNMLPPRSGQSGYTYGWAPYVDAAWNVASLDTSGVGGTSVVSVADFTQGPRMLGADTDTYGNWQSGDLVHPSNQGHQVIADQLLEFLTSASM